MGKEELNKAIQELLEQEIIKEVTSAITNSPVQ